MLIDSNILIYALNSRSPKNKVAQAFIQSQKEIAVAQQNIFETLRILTHTKFPQPVNPSEAVKSIKLVTKHALIISPTFDTVSLTYELIKKYDIQGTEIFDAYLVATAISNGITKIATNNEKHLKKYKEVTIVNPFA